MRLQTIKLNGQDFVLLPAACYKTKKKQIDKFVSEFEDIGKDGSEYVPFKIENYFDNPVALERVRRRVTQKKLSKLMGCTQAYISQLEHSKNVSAAVLAKVKKVLKDYPDIWGEIQK